MVTVRMESGGSWYSPKVKAQAILARRAMRENVANYDVLAGEIDIGEGSGDNHPPTRQTAKKWEDENPNYPEQAVRRGLVKTADLTDWAREQLQPANARKTRRNQTGPKVNYNPNAAFSIPRING